MIPNLFLFWLFFWLFKLYGVLVLVFWFWFFGGEGVLSVCLKGWLFCLL